MGDICDMLTLVVQVILMLHWLCKEKKALSPCWALFSIVGLPRFPCGATPRHQSLHHLALQHNGKRAAHNGKVGSSIGPLIGPYTIV